MSSDNYSLFGEPSTANTLAPSEADTVSLFEPTSTINTRSLFDPVKSLEERKAEKLAHLGQKSQYSNLSDSYTELENGILESNANKIWNELSGAEFSSIWDYASNNLALGQDENGYYNISTGKRYEGPVRRAYGYGTQGDDTTYKFGLARGDRDSSDSRYTDYAVGPEGVDLSKKQHDILLPDYIAQTVEALGHGRKEALAGRVVPDRLDLENYDRFGGGATEYYKSKEAFFGDPTSETYGTVFSPEQAKSVLYDYATQSYVSSPFYKGGYTDEDFKTATYERLAQQAQRREADNADFGDRLVNAGAAFGRTLTKEVAVDFADWVGEGINSLTNGKVGWDVGTEEEKTKMVNELFGFNPLMAEKEYEQAAKYARSIVEGVLDENKEVSYSDVYELVKIGVTTPEMLGDSIGFIGSFFVPFLGWGGKATKADKAIKTTEKLLKAGVITKDVAKAQVAAAKAEVTILNKVRQYSQANAGLMQVSAGNVNDQIDAYKAEHGEGPSVGKVAQMFATETLMLSLDRWADLSVLRAPAALKGARDAFSALAKEGKTKLLAKTVATAGGLVANMGKEAAQEYLQEIGQEFNVKFNFDDNGTFLSAVNEAGDVLLDKEMQIKGVTGAGLGAGGAVQFATIGAVPKVLGATFKGTGTLVNSVSPKKPASTLRQSFDDVEVPPTEDEVDVAKTEYRDLLVRLSKSVAEGKVTADNIGSYLDDVEQLNNTKHIISTSSTESVEQGEAIYNQMVDQLEAFISENPDLQLAKRIGRKTVQESMQGKATAEELASLPEQTQNAFVSFASAIGDGETRDLATSVKFVANQLQNATYESFVEEEEETLAPYLKEMELALTGKVSEDLSTSFNNVQTFLKNNKVADIGKAPSGEVLGSSPSSEGSVETEYDDYTRAVDAERIVQAILGSGRTYDEDFQGKVFNFARRNGVKEERLNSIVKSYTSVEEEATVGNRGYIARLSRLKGLVESTNPRQKDIDRELGEIVRMQSAIENSVQGLQRGIQEAINKASMMNRQKIVSDKSVKVQTEYMKYNPKTKAYDEPFVILVRKGRDGKWFADVEEANKRLSSKQAYVKDIMTELRSITGRANTKGTISVPDFGNYKVPVKSGKGSTVRDNDAKYIEGVKAILESVGLSGVVNKILLGDSKTKKWAPKGDYYKANALIINTEEFSEDDVVLVNSTGVTQRGKKENNFFVPDLVTANDADPESLTDAQKSFKAAVDAGATIVLDKDMLSKENGQAKRALAAYLVGKKGYVNLEGANGTVFVKPNATNKAALEARSAGLKAEKEVADKQNANKESLVDLALAIQFNVDPKTGETLTEEAKAKIKQQFDDLSKVVLDESFKGDQDNLLSFLGRRVKDDVKQEAEKILKDPNPAPIAFENKALEAGVAAFISAEEQKDVKGQETLLQWKQLTEVEQATGKDRESKLKTILEAVGSAPKTLVKRILSKELSFTVGKNDLYEVLFMEAGSQKIVTKLRREPLTEDEVNAFVVANDGKGTVFNKKKHIFLGSRRVVQDASKLVKLSRTTVLNSIPVDALPFAIRDIATKFSNKALRALQKVSDAELAEQTDSRVNGSFLTGSFNLYNSPARGIIFNNEGKPNEEVLAAMYLAVADMLKTDMGKLTRGYKTDADIALMFGVQEFEVTKEMRDFVKEHGVFLKTAANSLGKAIFKQLGLSKKIGEDVSDNEFESLVADMGNSALLLAEQEGLIEFTNAPSDTLAGLYRDGEKRYTDAKTYFVNVKDKDVKKGKYTRKEPIEAITNFVKTFDEVIATFPEAVLGRKEPYFNAPNEDRLNQAFTEVRNDIVGLDVPSSAKTTLELLMSTAYEFDAARVADFLNAVDADGSKVKELLGFVELTDPRFDNMLFEDKEIQEVKNRDIEKSINELRLLQKRIEESGEADPSLFFDYFYAGNNRYMLDSNTINPQTDKIARFLIVPKAHKMQYKVTTNANGGLLFNATSSTGTSDQSYTVRLAIAQGLGQGVDKLDAKSVIDFADAVLSMSVEQIAAVKQALLTNGEYGLQVVDGPVHHLEAEHMTHALQVIDFLTKLKEGNGSFESSLSLEFDSLTSGFANKVQQMPILKDMDAHFARTGVLTEAYQRMLMENENFGEVGEGFNPAQGQSIADVLYAGKNVGFYDSYQNLAKTTIDELKTGEVQRKNLTQPATKTKGTSGMGVFDAIKPLLPGGQFMEDGATVDEIKGAIRNLFKNPFMIFNYSASIGRIITNLGMDVTKNLAREIATADFTKEKNAAIKAVATNLLNSATIYYPGSDAKQIKTAEELQKVLRENPVKSLKIKSFKVGQLERKEFYPRNLEDLIENVVKLTYGEVIKSVFENEFKPFIEVQNAMNDTFKTAFRIFDHKRVEMLKEMRLNKENNILTVEDHAKVLEALWNDFPWIVGPLTGSNNKKDVIAVVTTSTRAPRAAEMARVSPQTVLGTGHSEKTRTVTPLVRYLEEAVSAGSVLPFHAIDGAEMSYAINQLGMSAITAIHDAIIAPIDQSDAVGFLYQKGMQNTNGENYVLADALKGLADRLRKTIEAETFTREFKDVSVKGLKSAKKDDTFVPAAKQVLANIDAQIEIINKAREEYYGENGKLQNAWYGNLVGTPGGMYQVGMTEPDLSYVENFKEVYGAVDLDFEEEIGDNTIDSYTANMPGNAAIKNLVNAALKAFDGTESLEAVLLKLAPTIAPGLAKRLASMVEKELKLMETAVKDLFTKQTTSTEEETDLDAAIDAAKKGCE